MGGRDDGAAGGELGMGDDLGDVEDGRHARVGSGEALDPLVAVRVAKAVVKAARMAGCASSSSWEAASSGQPRAAQRLAKNFASMAATATHFESAAR